MGGHEYRMRRGVRRVNVGTHRPIARQKCGMRGVRSSLCNWIAEGLVLLVNLAFASLPHLISNCREDGCDEGWAGRWFDINTQEILRSTWLTHEMYGECGAIACAGTARARRYKMRPRVGPTRRK